MEDQKRVVEINGVKIEVDLRTAKRVDEFKVGDAVKVLVKSYSDYASYPGVIVGFDEFKSLPTIIVAYLKTTSWEQPLNFVYLNAKSEGTEIIGHDPKDLGLERGDVLAAFDREILKKENEIKELSRKKRYFLEMFGRYFESPQATESA